MLYERSIRRVESHPGVGMVAGSNFWPLGRIWMDLGQFLDDFDRSCGENFFFISIRRDGDGALCEMSKRRAESRPGVSEVECCC